jgi:hypothetical protein
MARLEIESRHSDYGADAGGYAVLRFDGEWVGRVNRATAEKLIAYVEQLEQASERSGLSGRDERKDFQK